MYDPIVMKLLRKVFQISDNYVLIKENISSQKFTFKKERSKLELLKKQLCWFFSFKTGFLKLALFDL